MENSSLFNAINQDLSILGPENTTIWSTSVSAFACPSDIGAGAPHVLNSAYLPTSGIPDLSASSHTMVFTSYSGCFGSLSTSGLPNEAGHCLVPPQKITQNNGCFNDISVIRLSSITDGLSQTLFVSEKINDIDIYDSYGWLVTGNMGDTLFTAMYPPNLFGTGGSSSPIPSSASSFHSGGINALMGDGSARFINDTIQS